MFDVGMLHSGRILIAGIALFGGATIALADDTGFGYMHSLTKSGGRTCFADHYHSGSGSGKTKEAAFNDALKSWWGYTAGEYGSDWAHWTRSASQTVSYSKTDTGWSATIESRPCK